MGKQQRRFNLDAFSIPGTEDIDYQEYSFHRKYINPESDDITELACSHSHQFYMLDGKGDETTGQIAIDSNTEENRRRVLAAHEALIDADCLLICVERGQNIVDQQKSSINAGKQYMERLRDLLNLKRRRDQNTIICFTKSDRYGGKVAGFDSALCRLFGMYGREIGYLLRDLNNTENEPPHYFVSAVGYCYDPITGNVIPNFEEGSNKLIDLTNWLPYEVEKPFFDVFTKSEQNSLNSKDFNLFHAEKRLSRFLYANNFRKKLSKAYIGYNVMMNSIK